MADLRVPLRLPSGFNPNSPAHTARMLALVAADNGEGDWVLESVDLGDGTADAVRRTRVDQVSSTHDGLVLTGDWKTSDGPRLEKVWREKYEPTHPGVQLLMFDPANHRAVLGPLNPAEARCREHVANVLRVKPWEVTVRQRKDKGFDVRLPGSYVPSRHDKGLQEVALTQGHFGWFARIDPKTLTATIVPSDPPTFADVYPFDFAAVPHQPMSDRQRFTLPLGMALAPPGKPNAPLEVNLSDSSGFLLVGLAGGGKSTLVQALIFSALARGFRLALINKADKKTDMEWAKPYVWPGMWGCENRAEAVAVAKLVNEEGARLGCVLAANGAAKWQDLPADVKADRANAPLLLVADELAGLLTAPKLPTGLTSQAKALPEFVQMQQDLLEAALLTTTLTLTSATYRAAGIRVGYITQQPNERYGFSTTLKGNLPNRIILGPNPSAAEKGHAFRAPEKVPDMPGNITADEGASQGAGLAELDGQEPVVLKGFFAPLDDYVAAMRKLGLPVTGQPRPTAEQVARLVPRIGGDGADDLDDEGPGMFGEERLPSGRPQSSLPPEFGPQTALGADGLPLRGAAAAAKLLAQGAPPPCPACGKPIDPSTGRCGCSW